MPYEIEWYPRGVIRHFSGIVTMDDVLTAFREIHVHPAFDQVRCILHDCSAMTGRDWGKQEIVELGTEHLGARLGMSRAIDIIVTTDFEFQKFLSESLVVVGLPHPIEFYETLDDGMKRFKELLATNSNMGTNG
jgi:hypothetical protein